MTMPTRRRLVLHLLLQPERVLLRLPELRLGVREEADAALALLPVRAHLEGGRGGEARVKGSRRRPEIFFFLVRSARLTASSALRPCLLAREAP